MSGISDEDRQQASQRQKDLECCAVERVKPWGTPQPDDYDFRSWARSLEAGGKAAGCIYEYARESQKLRCLLALMNRKRPREAWEIERPALIDGRTPGPDDIDSYPAEANWRRCSFENFDEHGAERALGGFFYCLAELADDLADNVSFGELFRRRQDELEKAFGGLNKLQRVKGRFGDFFLVPGAVMWGDGEKATDEWNQRIIRKNGSEDVVIRINWNFTDSEIGEAMKQFAEAFRPTGWENAGKDVRAGKDAHFFGEDKVSHIKSYLDALSVMRLWKRLPKARHLRQRIREVTKVTDYKGCKDYVVAHRQAFRAGQYEPPTRNARVEMSKARDHSLSFFQRLFPSEKPSNY